MKRKEKRFDYGEHAVVFPDISNTASANECTGLMPTPPETEDELEAYKTLHSMATPEQVPEKLPGRREIRDGVFDDKPPEFRF